MRLSVLLSALSKHCRCLVGGQTRLLSPQVTTQTSVGSFEYALNIGLITDDSREVRPGALFVAVPGGQQDGHNFIAQALQKGAVALVGEWPAERVMDALRTEVGHAAMWSVPYIQVRSSREALGWLHAAWNGYPSRQMMLIGVTGTDGKTTTTTLIHSILNAAGYKSGMVSTVSARIGEQLYDTGLHTTTPSAAEIQALLANMVLEGCTHAVLEVTSHGLDQHRVAGCAFDVAVVTNVTHEHLDYHGTWEAYLAAKARLFHALLDPLPEEWALGAKLSVDERVAVLNRDDASFKQLATIPVARRISYGVEVTDADVFASDVRFSPRGLIFLLHTPVGVVELRSPLVGRFNVSNILAAASVAVGLGVDLNAIAAGVENVHGVPGRMERIDEGQPFLAIVDFAHTPNALRRALETARHMAAPGGRVIVVFGAAGLRDRDKRWMMGQVAGRMADLVIVTAEDPRSESLSGIMCQIKRGLEAVDRTEGYDFWLVPDRGRAIKMAVDLARAGDVVIACGKGHEQSMCFGEVEYPWDDRVAMRAALRGTTLDALPTAHDAN